MSIGFSISANRGHTIHNKLHKIKIWDNLKATIRYIQKTGKKTKSNLKIYKLPEPVVEWINKRLNE